MRWTGCAASLGLIVLGSLPCFTANARSEAPTVELKIAQEPLGQALQDLAKQSGIQIIFFSEVTEGLTSPALKGQFTLDAALKQLLDDSHLTWRQINPTTIEIRPLAAVNALSKTEPGQTELPQGAPGSNTSSSSKASYSQDARVAQATPEQAQGDASVEQRDQQASRPVVLEEVIVTGSRLQRTADESAQEVHIYTAEKIAASGQTSINDFLSNLPEVSVASRDGGISGNTGTTVQLHGLPIGTTLVLLNGRRVETSGINNSPPFFDLNNIPLAAVQRIEVVSQGSSAIYGSDAIAGVVNIILRTNFDGLEASVKYGWAADLAETDASVALGNRWEKGSLSIVGTFQTRGALEGFQRSVSANEDHTSVGGPDRRSTLCSPGNIFFPNGFSINGTFVQFAAVPTAFNGTPSISEFSATAGKLNKCSDDAFNSLIPATHRQGVLASGNYLLSKTAELFTELMYSHVQEITEFSPPFLFAEPGFSFDTASAANPFNPFGQTVGVGGNLVGLGTAGQRVDTDFFSALVGGRGSLSDAWHWEISGWESADDTHLTAPGTENFAAIQNALNSTDPRTALNPFIDGPAGSSDLLRSLIYDGKQSFRGSTLSANGFLRGPIARLPAGQLEVVVGSEYDRNSLYTNIIVPNAFAQAGSATFQRHSYAVFGEMRIPLVASHTSGAATLAASVAGRYDSYDDFHSNVTPQYGVEWRPLDGVLIRGTYGKAFKAPSLIDLHSPQTAFTGAIVNDPVRGGQPEVITELGGGNPRLNPETGSSQTVGILYSSIAAPGLQLSLTHWRIDENNSIQSLNSQTIVDHENLFPADVIRASSCPGGPPCPITQVSATLVNFGHISVAGFDSQALYKIQSRIGEITPSLALTETYHYTTALLPGIPGSDRTSMANDDGNWAPRWKGVAALGWKVGSYTASLSGRYVGSYKDYEPSADGTTRTIGNFWLFDANLRFAAGGMFKTKDQILEGSYVTVGGNNIFNRLPQYSDFFGGSTGYDPLEADILGRFLYVQVGIKW